MLSQICAEFVSDVVPFDNNNNDVRVRILSCVCEEYIYFNTSEHKQCKTSWNKFGTNSELHN